DAAQADAPLEALDRVDADAEADLLGPAGLDDLRDDARDGRDRDGEADAGRRAALRVDHRVHPDELALGVEQRPARVARVDRCVGLDHVANAHAAGALHRTADRADHARRQREVEAERVADGDRLLTDLELLALRDADRDEELLRRVDLEDGDVLARLEADDLRLEDLLVVEGDAEGASAFDDVEVRDDVALLVPDEAGARTRGHVVL